MAKRTRPRPTTAPKPGADQKGEKPKGGAPKEAEGKQAFSSDTRKRVNSVIAEIEAEMHMTWRTMNSAMGPGDFEAFKEAWLKNYANVATGVTKPEDKPVEEKEKDNRPVVKQLNERVKLDNKKRTRR